MTPDERLRAAILHFIRTSPDAYAEGFDPPDVESHLRGCADLIVTEPDGWDTTCPEDTCEFVKLEASVTCLHGFAGDYTYYSGGELEDVFKEMDKQGRAEA